MSRDKETASLERRTGPRAAVDFALAVKTPESEGFVHALIHDLSSAGIALFADLDLPDNGAFEVTLYVPYEMTLTQTLPVRFRAEVLRSVQNGESMRRRIAATLSPMALLSPAGNA